MTTLSSHLSTGGGHHQHGLGFTYSGRHKAMPETIDFQFVLLVPSTVLTELVAPTLENRMDDDGDDDGRMTFTPAASSAASPLVSDDFGLVHEEDGDLLTDSFSSAVIATPSLEDSLTASSSIGATDIFCPDHAGDHSKNDNDGDDARMHSKKKKQKATISSRLMQVRVVGAFVKDEREHTFDIQLTRSRVVAGSDGTHPRNNNDDDDDDDDDDAGGGADGEEEEEVFVGQLFNKR